MTPGPELHLGAVGPTLAVGIGAMVVLLSAPRTPIMLAFTLLAYEACSTLGLWAMARQFLLGPRDSQPGVISELTKTAMSGARMQMLGSLLAALNPLICILFARTLEPGSVTMVEYAGRLWNMVPLLFSGSLMLFYSQRSRAESRQQPGKTATHAVARNLGLVALAFSIVAIAFSRDIIDLIYGFGKMDEGERSVLAGLFSMYLLGAGAYVAGLVYVRSISAMRKVHIIALAAGLGVVLIIPLNLVMIRYFALEGIGVASSMASIAVALFLYRAYTYQSAKPAGKR